MRRCALLGALFWLAGVAAPAGGSESVWLTAALFGQLDQTATFDVNADTVVTAADLAERARIGDPRSSGCGGPLPPEGTLTIEVAGSRREYTVRLPADYDHVSPRPVVFDFHGFTLNAAWEESATGLAANWPEAIGVYPQGLLRTFPAFPGVVGPGWQVSPDEPGQRDLPFFDAMVSRMVDAYCVNPERLYATGFSNGAVFSHLLGCTRGGVLAAIGPRAGFMIGCLAAPPLAVIMSHGTLDPIAPFVLGATAAASWTAFDGCVDTAVPYGNGCELHPQCADGVRVAFCAWEGAHVPDPHFAATLFRFFREHAR